MKAIFFMVLLCSFDTSFSQISITGPTCVLAGFEYQYNLTGLDDNTTVCVNGGTITGNSSSCINKVNVAYVKISWKSSGVINLINATGKTSLQIAITNSLLPGDIQQNIKTQNISFNAIPLTILCSSATGGGCNPTYSYQWQQSADNLNWKDLPGKNQQNLSLAALQESSFFRRKTMENNSQTIAYTASVIIYVDVDKRGHQ